MNTNFTALLKVVEFASAKHHGQMYTPVLSYLDGHLVPVMMEIPKLIGRTASHEDQYIYGSVALLHDVLEDTSCSFQEIVDACGEEHGVHVAHYVGLLTKRPGEAYDEYLIRVASEQVSYVIKVADITCNMRQNVLEGNLARAAAYSTKLALLHTLRSQS